VDPPAPPSVAPRPFEPVRLGQWSVPPLLGSVRDDPARHSTRPQLSSVAGRRSGRRLL
jgi:hypothetical protein